MPRAEGGVEEEAKARKARELASGGAKSGEALGGRESRGLQYKVAKQQGEQCAGLPDRHLAEAVARQAIHRQDGKRREMDGACEDARRETLWETSGCRHWEDARGRGAPKRLPKALPASVSLALLPRGTRRRQREGTDGGAERSFPPSRWSAATPKVEAVLAAEEGRQSALRIRNEQGRKADRLSCPAAKRISGKLTGRVSDRISGRISGRISRKMSGRPRNGLRWPCWSGKAEIDAKMQPR